MKEIENTSPFEIYTESELLMRKEGHDVFRPSKASIVFIVQGTVSFQVNGISKDFKACDTIIISPRNSYRLNAISEDFKLYITTINFNSYQKLRFNFNRFEIYKILAIENNNAFSIPPEDFAHFVTLLQNMHHQSYSAKTIKYRNEVQLQLFGALIYMIVNQLESLIYANPTTPTLNSRKEELTFSFLELASKDYLAQRELNYYASKLCISIKYLSICVKEITGHPPSYFLTRLVLEEARNQLANKKQSMEAIASDLNFSDAYSFSKFFKKNTGKSPSVFRKEIMQIHTI